MSGMDDQNPNPRQLAHLMRKMSEMTGEKVPQQMEQMLKRLEAGEDPERIEEEMGDIMGDAGLEDGGPEESKEQAAIKARLRSLRRKPQRDPTLYEMSDFLE